MSNFITSLCSAIAEPTGGNSQTRLLIGRAIADTIAVAAAGFSEPVVRASLSAYPGDSAKTWSGETCESKEAAVMLNATATHALDFDDVYLDSMIHPSAVIVPALLVLGAHGHLHRSIEAMAAGLIAGNAIASMLGAGHYQRGWHGTGTIGAFSAAAAAGKLAGLTDSQQRSAFALAAAMSGGLQLNFSTMAKPCQAGFAAVAGFRAVRLAAAGVTGAQDIFGPGGYLELYRGHTASSGDLCFELRADRIAVKLYPSCYAASRLIGVALDARSSLGAIFSDPSVTCRLVVPTGSLVVLRFDDPVDGMQAKFSAPYNVCTALVEGAPHLTHFEDKAVNRKSIRACMRRLVIDEDSAQISGGDIRIGHVILEVLRDGLIIKRFTREAIPGSGRDPVTIEQFRTKASSCFDRYRRACGRDFPMRTIAEEIPEVHAWLA